MLREADKKPGWSLNTKSGHKQEYYIHLTTDFYQRFETVEGVNSVKESMQAFFFVNTWKVHAAFNKLRFP